MTMPLSWRLLSDEFRELEWIRKVAGFNSPAALRWWIAREQDYRGME